MTIREHAWLRLRERVDPDIGPAEINYLVRTGRKLKKKEPKPFPVSEKYLKLPHIFYVVAHDNHTMFVLQHCLNPAYIALISVYSDWYSYQKTNRILKRYEAEKTSARNLSVKEKQRNQERLYWRTRPESKQMRERIDSLPEPDRIWFEMVLNIRDTQELNQLREYFAINLLIAPEDNILLMKDRFIGERINRIRTYNPECYTQRTEQQIRRANVIYSELNAHKERLRDALIALGCGLSIVEHPYQKDGFRLMIRMAKYPPTETMTEIERLCGEIPFAVYLSGTDCTSIPLLERN